VAPAKPHFLICDSAQEAAQTAAMAFDAAGVSVDWASLAPTEVVERCKVMPPRLLVVRAEPGSVELSVLQARLVASKVTVPIVLVCTDVTDAALARCFREGVVELLPHPFQPKAHTARVIQVADELETRPGEARGRGGPNELQRLVRHVLTSKRTGGLVVKEGTPEEGRAVFVRGVLKSARLQGLHDQQALSAITQAQAAWRFVEGLQGPAAIVELDERVTEEIVVKPRPSAPTPAPVEGASISPDAARTPLLFVDDDASVVSMLATYFGKRGYPVATARDGLEALEVLSRQQVEVVLADLNMPRLDGWGLLRLVREDFRTHEVPMALYSAHDDYRESLRAMHSGAQAYFSKTLRLAALESQIQALLGQRRAFVASFAVEGALVHPLGKLGPQWVLRQLERAQLSGRLDGSDEWATWQAHFVKGRLSAMQATVSSAQLVGERALLAFLGAAKMEGSFMPGAASVAEHFGGASTGALVTKMAAAANEERRLAREEQLKSAKALLIHQSLYQLYRTVGPPAWQPAAKLLCEDQLTPAEVIARTGLAPHEVANLVKDLLRRGIAELRR
jgi:CheY-like chemotaxis protein